MGCPEAPGGCPGPGHTQQEGGLGAAEERETGLVKGPQTQGPPLTFLTRFLLPEPRSSPQGPLHCPVNLLVDLLVLVRPLCLHICGNGVTSLLSQGVLVTSTLAGA